MDAVERFYDENARQEWDRHDRQRLEFAVTMRAFADYLPHPPAHILDVGGGPGRYAVALADQGYAVALVDLSGNCLAVARDRAREAGVELTGYVHADARSLGQFADGSVDVVLLMGPLYHLPALAERRKAVDEARRLLRERGLLFAAFISRYAPIRFEGKSEPAAIVERLAWAEETLATGVFRPWSERPGFAGFTDAYLIHPSEITPFMEDGGFETLDLIACEGAFSMIDERINGLTGEAWQTWVDLSYRLGKDPSVHGAAEHLLYVGRKK